MSNTDRDALLERWATGMETLEQYYENLYGPPATPAVLPSVTDINGMLESIADGLERARININKKSHTYHNTDTAYIKTVPAGEVQQASVEKLGGRTLVMNQLINDGDFSADDNTLYWKTQSNSSPLSFADGVATLTFGGSYSVYNPAISQLNIGNAVAGHKYYLKYDEQASFACNAYMRSNALGDAAMGTLTPGEWVTIRQIKTASSSAALWFYLGTSAGSPSADDTVKFRNVMLIDLTLMFGAGNEPTIAQFDAIFPSDFYDYNAGALLSAGVTDVVSKDGDNAILETLTIPAEVQALPGYGLSAGSVYNYIDFDSKKFVQRVGSVDLSTLTFGYGPTVGWSATLSNVKDPADGDTAFNGVSDNYTAVSRNTQATAFAGGTDTGMVSVSGGKVYVGTGDIGIVPSGTLYYELDEPVETDISEYITEDNLITVEPGGTLTFPGQDSNRIPVPSTETFWVNIL